jgi:hypothetical protein
MIYNVTIHAPAIYEVVVTEADDEQQAKERAIYSAPAPGAGGGRHRRTATDTVAT